MSFAILFIMEFLRRNLLFVFVILLLIFNFFVWGSVLAEEKADNTLRVYFLNIGQGDATFIETPNGNQILIDGGRTDNKVLSELGEIMELNDREIDLVLATHPDADHIGGIPSVLERYTVLNFLESGNRAKDTKIFDTLLLKMKEEEAEGMKTYIAKGGQRFVLDEERGIFLDVLFPVTSMVNAESNSASVVTRLTYGEVCMLFMGDAPKAVENYIAEKYQDFIDCEVLKVGHHGSRTSSLQNFVKIVSPVYSVISVGENNSYGHPNKEVLLILEKWGGEILRTDEVGRVEMISDGSFVSFVKPKGRLGERRP